MASSLSNAERKRQARARQLVEQERAAKAEQGAITAFRVEEQFWKTRGEVPDWSLAFSAGSKELQVDSDSILGESTAGNGAETGTWTDRKGAEWQIQKFGLKNGKCAFTFTDKPGLLYLPQYLGVEEQEELIAASLHETTGPASRTNLDSHYQPPSSGWWSKFADDSESIILPKYSENSTPDSGERNTERRLKVDLEPMNEESFRKDVGTTKAEPPPSETVQATAVGLLIRKLRWSIIGLEYHWGTKSYKWDRPAMPMPDSFVTTCRRIASDVPWNRLNLTSNDTGQPLDVTMWHEYKPEAGVVNFYQYRDSLTAHVDQSEVDSVRPLISISLGESCIFLAGGRTRDESPIPLLLQSGDVVIMSGASRRIFHGVPRIIEHSMGYKFDSSKYNDGYQIQRFMQGTRLNVNVRQVFSKELKPA